jgi:hypothetical protein
MTDATPQVFLIFLIRLYCSKMTTLAVPSASKAVLNSICVVFTILSASFNTPFTASVLA